MKSRSVLSERSDLDRPVKPAPAFQYVYTGGFNDPQPDPPSWLCQEVGRQTSRRLSIRLQPVGRREGASGTEYNLCNGYPRSEPCGWTGRCRRHLDGNSRPKIVPQLRRQPTGRQRRIGRCPAPARGACGAGCSPAVFHLSRRSASHQPIPPTPIAMAKQMAIQNRMSASACDISVQRLAADVELTRQCSFSFASNHPAL